MLPRIGFHRKCWLQLLAIRSYKDHTWVTFLAFWTVYSRWFNDSALHWELCKTKICCKCFISKEGMSFLKCCIMRRVREVTVFCSSCRRGCPAGHTWGPPSSPDCQGSSDIHWPAFHQTLLAKFASRNLDQASGSWGSMFKIMKPSMIM